MALELALTHTHANTHTQKVPVKTVRGETDSRVVFCQRNTLFLQNVNILIYLNSSLQTRPPLFLSSSPPLPCNLSFSPAQCPAAPRCPLSLWQLVMSVLALANAGCPDHLVLSPYVFPMQKRACPLKHSKNLSQWPCAQGGETLSAALE